MGDRLNQRWAAQLVGALVAPGVRHVVVCPGSRSTPLTLAVAERSELTVWPIVDERSAGFFALGLAKATQKAVALVCTSGSAGAHFLPAVIEASHGAVPLLVLTADRPWELQGFGAAQTIDQSSLFGRFARRVELLTSPEESEASLNHLVAVIARAVATAQGSHRGPVHVNVPFREPLAPPDAGKLEPAYVNPPVFSERRTQPDISGLKKALEASKRCLFVCGPRERFDGFADAVHRLSWRWGAPVLAEAASNVRYGFPESVACYDAMLRNPRFAEVMRPDVVVRFGGGLTSKTPQAWLDESPARVFHVVEDGLVFDPQHRAEEFIAASALDVCRELAAGLPRSTEYRETFLRVQGHVEGRLHTLSQELDEPTAARALVAGVPAGVSLMVSSSMPIRDVDAFAPRSQGPLRLFSNRGANGIDGIVSTALGIAAGSEGRAVVYLGDLALLHDLHGLLIARQHKLSLTLVVSNNDGGGIFNFLPIAERTRHFERLFATPHGVDLAHVAALAGGQLHRPAELVGFRRAIATGLDGGVHLIEVKTDRKENVELHKRYFNALSSVAEVQIP